MNCPRCDADTITRTLSSQGGGYYAAVCCEGCERTAWALTADPGDAIDAAEEQFFGKGGLHG